MKTKRRLRTLMYKHSSYIHWGREQVIEGYELRIKNKFNNDLDVFLELKEIYTLGDELGLNDSEIHSLWYEWSKLSRLNKAEFKKRPIKDGRDNKDLRVGSGGSNRNSIRYPSKKRSIKTWKKFYKLFPINAFEDGWDGKTSKKMK